MSLRPWYNKDANYQTNAKSFMDYLARTNKFIEVLIEDYDNFQELVIEKLERIKFDSEMAVEEILLDWLEDGTLERIINDEVFNNKADTSWVQAELTILAQQITEEIEEINRDLTNGFSHIENVHTEMTHQSEGVALNIKYPPSNLEAAIGDGVTDDTEAIQAVIEYARDNEYTKIVAPKGKYKVRPDVIKLARGVVIEGTGKGRHLNRFGTVFDFSGHYGKTGIQMGIENQSNIGLGLKDIQITGSQGIEAGVRFDYRCYNAIMENVEIQHFETGVWFGRAWNVIMERITTHNTMYGFRFEDNLTTSVFDGCIAYGMDDQPNAPTIGWLFSTNVSSTSFVGCGADGPQTSVKVVADLHSSGFYNFVAESYEIGFHFDTPEGTVNLYGFGEYNPHSLSLQATVFKVDTIKRLNIMDSNLTPKRNEPSTLFDINTGRAQPGCIHLENTQIGPLDSNELSKYLINNGTGFDVLTKKNVSADTILYSGKKISVKKGSVTMKIILPRNANKASVKVSAYGVSPLLESQVGGVSYISIRSVGGQLLEQRQPAKGMNIVTVNESPDSVTITVSFDNERITEGQNLDNVLRMFDVEIFVHGRDARVENTTAFPVAIS